MKNYLVLQHVIISVRFILCATILTFQLTNGAQEANGSENPCLETEHRTFSLYIENDIFSGNDSQYTSGLKLTWSRYGLSALPDDAWLHKWLYPVIKKIGFDRPESTEKALTFSIGQSIYTPEDIDKTELIPDDRPYAGITYAELGFHRRRTSRMHSLGLVLGIVGPDSYAEDVQTEIHKLTDSHDPKGWDNQLENEPVLSLVYGYKNRLFSNIRGSGPGSDVILSAGATLGNLRIGARTGLMLRYGWNIPYDFGNFPIQPATCFNAEVEKKYCSKTDSRLGLHIFFSANAQAVAQDIFLDGNTFRDSHSVDKKPFVGTFLGGLGLNNNRFKAVLAYVYQTKAFDSQDDPHTYGTLNLTFRY